MHTENHRKRGIYLLPNLFTVSSLFAGFYSIVSALNGNFVISAISVFIAMIMDTLDGRVARLTNTMSAFGAEFDSLSDMISFGLAPALIAYCWSLNSLGKVGWLVAFLYVAATALRLARFNVQTGKGGKRYFQGLPCTAAAPVLVGGVWCGIDFGVNPQLQLASIIFAVIIILVSIFMVSNLRYRSFKDADLKNHISFVVVLIAVLAVVLISIDPSKVLFTIAMIYAFSGPISTIWGLHQRRKKRNIMLLNVKSKSN